MCVRQLCPSKFMFDLRCLGAVCVYMRACVCGCMCVSPNTTLGYNIQRCPSSLVFWLPHFLSLSMSWLIMTSHVTHMYFNIARCIASVSLSPRLDLLYRRRRQHSTPSRMVLHSQVSYGNPRERERESTRKTKRKSKQASESGRVGESEREKESGKERERKSKRESVKMTEQEQER